MTLELAFAPNEDPFVVAHGGFYRRWFSMIDDIAELQAAVARLEGTTQDKWVPVWEEVGRRHEAEGDRLEEAGDYEGSRRSFLQAKTYYAIGRFPGRSVGCQAADQRGLRPRLPQGLRPSRPTGRGRRVRAPGQDDPGPFSCSTHRLTRSRRPRHVWRRRLQRRSGLGPGPVHRQWHGRPGHGWPRHRGEPVPMGARVGERLGGGRRLSGRPTRGRSGADRGLRHQSGRLFGHAAGRHRTGEVEGCRGERRSSLRLRDGRRRARGVRPGPQRARHLALRRPGRSPFVPPDVGGAGALRVLHAGLCRSRESSTTSPCRC